VADHGPGIDPAHVEHIFDRFYRADAGRSRDRGGSGLGLSIAASVVAAHGGDISYSNTSGGGATFTLTLPRDQGVEAEDELPSQYGP
jgi:two-component system OmpR family sensor kinase